MREVAGMSVLVTGGGSGIGAGTARHLLARGALVTISGRREERLRETAEGYEDRCLAVPGDVTVAADRERLVAAAVEHGGGRLDGLVNAAANMYRGPIAELDEQELLALFHANVVGPMLLTGLCAEHLGRAGGAVVLFGSVHIKRAFPGASPYAATKGALEALTGVLAAELGPRVCASAASVPEPSSPRSTSGPGSPTTPPPSSASRAWPRRTPWDASARSRRSPRPSATCWPRSGPRAR